MKVLKIDPSQVRFHHEWVWGTLFLAIGLGVLLAPIEKSTLACPFKKITGVPCLTCGATRSLGALRHFELWRAFVENPLIATLAIGCSVYCAYAWTAILFRTRRIRIQLTRPWEPAVARVAAAVTLVATWAYLIAARR